MKTYIFSRKTGTSGTKIMEIDKKEAIRVMKENRNNDYQLGMLTGGNFDVVIKVYGEYAPFHKVKTVQELIKPDESIHSRIRRIVKGRTARFICKSAAAKSTQGIRLKLAENIKQGK